MDMETWFPDFLPLLNTHILRLTKSQENALKFSTDLLTECPCVLARMTPRYDTKAGLHAGPGSDTPSPGSTGVQMACLLVKPSPHVALTDTNQPLPSVEVQFYTVGDINSVAESPCAATATTGSQQMTGGSGLYDPVNYFPIVTARLHTLICMWPQRALFSAEPRR